MAAWWSCFPPAPSRPRPIGSDAIARSTRAGNRSSPNSCSVSGATVIPVWFGGQNSRLFQIASHLSLTLRLSLIFHEVRRRIGATVPVEIGEPIPFERLAMIKDRQAFADELRAATYALARDKQGAIGASLPPRFEARLFGRPPPN